MFGSTVTPQASPVTSMPLFVLPEKTLVRIRMSPPVESTNDSVVAVGRRALEGQQAAERAEGREAAGGVRDECSLFSPFPADTLPSGITPPTVVSRGSPSTRMPF